MAQIPAYFALSTLQVEPVVHVCSYSNVPTLSAEWGAPGAVADGLALLVKSLKSRGPGTMSALGLCVLHRIWHESCTQSMVLDE